MPAGTTALMSQWVVHRDPRYHRDPQRFDPDRWTAEYEKEMPRFAYFPFGGGPRQCIGAAFAMTEARLVLATVAQRFRMELVPGQRVEPYASITLRPKEGIRMTLAARSREANSSAGPQGYRFSLAAVTRPDPKPPGRCRKPFPRSASQKVRNHSVERIRYSRGGQWPQPRRTRSSESGSRSCARRAHSTGTTRSRSP